MTTPHFYRVEPVREVFEVVPPDRKYRDEDLGQEIADEFAALSGVHVWEQVCERVYLRVQDRYRGWIDHGQWWRRTTRGKRKIKAGLNARVANQKAAPAKVPTRICKGCKKPFTVNAYRERRKRDRVCSPACRGAARSDANLVLFNGRKDTLTGHAKRVGVDPRLALNRVYQGWDVERALTTPRGPNGRKKPKPSVEREREAA